MTFDPDALPVPDMGLRCVACGSRLAGAPQHACPQCGRPFSIEEHIPRGDFPVVIVDGEEVKVTPRIAELLRVAGIPFLEQTGPMEAIYGVTHPTWEKGRLAVPRANYFEVIELLLRDAAGESPSSPPAQREVEWTCETCGETNPGSFEVCWKCASVESA
jgi:predicted RNA-binding Zn-ribbon protein involved in translation (DUF1610 family)